MPKMAELLILHALPPVPEIVRKKWPGQTINVDRSNILKVTGWPKYIKHPFQILKHNTHRILGKMSMASMATTQFGSHNARARV